MAKNTAELEALHMALRFEKHGRKFYVDAMERTCHPVAKGLFDTLAKEEDKHVKFIVALHDELEKNGSWPKKVTIDMKKDFKLIFAEARRTIDKTVNITTDELEAMNTAVEMETKGEKMYMELSQKAKTPEEENVYTILAGEEAKHREFAEQHYQFFADKGLFTEE